MNVIGTPIKKASANIQLMYLLALSTYMGTFLKHSKSTRNIGGGLENSRDVIDKSPSLTMSAVSSVF